MRSNLFWLSDEQWQRIAPFLPTDVRGKDRVDDRRVISGILHVLKSALAGGWRSGAASIRSHVCITYDRCSQS